MIAYQQKFLYSQRIVPTFLPNYLKPLYRYIKKQYNLIDNPIFIEYSTIHHILSVQDLAFSKKIVFSSKLDKYGYQKIRWQSRLNQDFIEGVYTKSLHSIEKICFSIKKPKNIWSFLFLLEEFIAYNEVEYSEIWIPVSDLDFIYYLHCNSWNIAGYVLGWHFLPYFGKYEDMVVFTYRLSNKKMPDMKMIKEVQKLHNILIQVNLQKINELNS